MESTNESRPQPRFDHYRCLQERVGRRNVNSYDPHEISPLPTIADSPQGAVSMLDCFVCHFAPAACKAMGCNVEDWATLSAHQLSELHLCSCHASLYCSVWYTKNPRGFARGQPFQGPQLKCPAQRRGELLR
jgi:hypothetical protein